MIPHPRRFEGALAALAIATAVLGCQLGPAAVPSSMSDGPRVLTVSRVSALDPDGTDVDVTGSGFDVAKGIYVAFCVDNGADEVPGPCGGGIDTAGTSGSSVWISSNPPPYGRGLAVPYGPDGSFAVRLRVSQRIGTDVDCVVAACAVVTRNDHTRTSDRGQDLAILVAFGPPRSPLAALVGVAALVAAMLLAGAVLRRRRRRLTTDSTGS